MIDSNHNTNLSDHVASIAPDDQNLPMPSSFDGGSDSEVDKSEVCIWIANYSDVSVWISWDNSF